MLPILYNIKRLKRNIRYISTLKLMNFLRLYFSYSISKFGKERLSECKPLFISIETANYCNLHCPECPVGNNKYSMTEHKLFDLELFKSLIDELRPTLTHVILYFQGEPFLNKKLSDFISYAHQAKIYTSNSTNGQLFTKNNAKEIVTSGLDKIIISIDGSKQETYQKYRIGGNLNKTIEGIRQLVEYRKELKSATPMIEIQFLVLKTNEHQMTEMKQLAKSLQVDKLTFKTAQLSEFENGNELMPKKSRFSRYRKGKDGKFRIKGNQPNSCWRMWSGAVINASGEVLPCCFDKGSDFSFGNLNELSFSECWKNEKAFGFRNNILLNRKQFEMCRNCTNH